MSLAARQLRPVDPPASSHAVAEVNQAATRRPTIAGQCRSPNHRRHRPWKMPRAISHRQIYANGLRNQARALVNGTGRVGTAPEQPFSARSRPPRRPPASSLRLRQTSITINRAIVEYKRRMVCTEATIAASMGQFALICRPAEFHLQCCWMDGLR